jgi:cytochrome b subunit of formate dehydrogenase
MKITPFFSLLLCTLLVVCVPKLIAQANSDCLACHSDRSLSMERGGKHVSITVDEGVLSKSAHASLRCVSCHVGFDPGNIPHRAQIGHVKCLSCHKESPAKHVFHPQLAQALNKQETPDISCQDCHGSHGILPVKAPGSKFSEATITSFCGDCHGDVREAYQASAHGRALALGVKGAPTCLACHRSEITSVTGIRDSLQFKREQEKVCLSCHLDNPEVKAKTAPSAGFIAAYEKSVHGAALTKGNPSAANCIDCHGSHEMKKGIEPTSLVYKENIPRTCGKCHGQISVEYQGSVHGVAVARGVQDSPVCTDCHGEHNILAPSNPKSPVAAANVAAKVCNPCHSSVKLTEKYGIAANRSQTFADSYHGLAIRAGDAEVANCASCHGVHNIKPSSDPTSTINKANLTLTCGKCHPGANNRFITGAVHLSLNAQEQPLLYWLATGYIILIVSLIGGMFFHNLLDFIKKSRRTLMVRRGILREEPPAHRLYLRMDPAERLQHGALLVSFITLVVTGFALKYPDAWWVAPVRSISPMMFGIRGVVHRVAGVAMVLASVYHLYYILVVPRGRQLLRDLMPVPEDITDAIGVLKYNLGLSKEKPKFGRFSYIEKSEYWALVWGTIVMAATGAILWFDNTFLNLLTKLWWDAARTIHYYEAWLATLAIIVWHFYFVLFNPDVYPMNLAWWKGSLSEEEMREEHPLELEEIQRREMEEALADSPVITPADVPKKEEAPR